MFSFLSIKANITERNFQKDILENFVEIFFNWVRKRFLKCNGRINSRRNVRSLKKAKYIKSTTTKNFLEALLNGQKTSND
jgi:hypothetical protein